MGILIGGPACGGANMPSEEKVGPHGEPWHLEQNGGQLQVLTADKELVAVIDMYSMPLKEREVWEARWDHAIACVNALHAASLTPEQVRTIYGLQFAAERAEEVLSDSVRDEVPPEDDECITVRDLLRAALADLRKQA